MALDQKTYNRLDGFIKSDKFNTLDEPTKSRLTNFLDTEKSNFSGTIDPTKVKSTSLVQENKHINDGFMDKTKTMFSEVGKSVARSTVAIEEGLGGMVYAMGDYMIPNEQQVANMRRVGKSEDYINRSIQMGERVKGLGKVSKEYWNDLQGSKFIKGDEEIFSGGFIENFSWTRTISTIAGAIPSLGAAAVASISTGSPMVGIAILSGLEAEDIYYEAREDEGMSRGKAGVLGAAVGVGTGVLETSLGPLDRFVKGGSGKVIKDIVMGSIREGGTEGLQQIWSNSVRKCGIDDAQDIFEGVIESIVAGAGSGGVIGGLTSKSKGKTEKAIKKNKVTNEEKDSIVNVVGEAMVNKSSEIDSELSKNIEKSDKAFKDAKIARDKSGKPIEITPEEVYAKNREINVNVPFKQKVAESIQRTASQAGEFANKAFVPISTRLDKISPKLKHAIRKYTYGSNIQRIKYQKQAKSFLKNVAEISPEEFADLDLALKNKDNAKVEQILKDNNLEGDFKEVKSMLDDIYKKAKKAGINVNYIEDYFPRAVGDVDGFLDYIQNTEQWSAIEQSIQENDPNNLWTDEEKVYHINQMLRGYGDKNIVLGKPGAAKERSVQDVTPELNKFYKDSSTALLQYINSMNTAIEARKFLGKGESDINDSIGKYVKDLVDDQVISHRQEAEVKEILTSLINERGATGIIAKARNAAYIYTMGSPISALTQLGDLGLSAYKTGAIRTAKGFVNSVRNNERITKEDLGIEDIAQEFAQSSTSDNAVRKVFKAIGLDYIDKLGKESLINGSLDRLQVEAQKDSKEFNDKLNDIFGEEAGQVKKDLKNRVPTENVKYLLFSELADVQPIAITEMPEYYVKGGNSRVFYMLKSYTLKLLDVYHNDVFRQMGTDPKKGVTNLLKLTFSLAMAGASADALKDLLLGKKIELSDLVVENILKLMVFSKFQLFKSKRDGVLTTLYQSILPPLFAPIDELGKDIGKTMEGKREFKDWRSLGRIPFVGKFYYWWFGGGQKTKRRNR